MKRVGPEEHEDDGGPLYSSLDKARAKGHDGARRAARRASRVEPGWRDSALEAVRMHAERNPRFLVEHLRRSLTVPDGADARALGAIVKEAERLGWIKADGWAPAASSHGSPKTVWASLIFREAKSA